MARPYNKTGKQQDLRMDWQIAGAKGVVCKRKHDAAVALGNLIEAEYWLGLAARHIERANSFLEELDSFDPELIAFDRIVGNLEHVGDDEASDRQSQLLHA